MRRTGIVVAAAVLVYLALFVGGCVWEGVSPKSVDDTFVLESISDNWVEVYCTRGTIHWGDGWDDDCRTKVAVPGVYGHFYERPAVYAARLEQNSAYVRMLVVPIQTISGHLELVDVSGMTITVRHWGIDLVNYMIDWGDGAGVLISSREYYAQGRERSHTYAQPGIYEVGVRSLEAPGLPTKLCAVVTVGRK